MRQFIIPYLVYDNALEAAKYYKDIFNGEIEYVMYGKDVPNCPIDDLERVFHLELKINGNYIYMSDGDFKPGSNNLLLDFKDLENMKQSYEKMKKTGKVIKELADTFWGAIYGLIEDKFGVKWEFHFMKPSN
jgi:PhnB protein